MLVLLFIIASASLAMPITNAASNCSVCQLEDSYSESNGYHCFQLNNGEVACTCPDQRYALNKPCRICDRKDICGDNRNGFCTETSIPLLGFQSNSTQYYACFCSDSTFYVGAACPTITTTTAMPVEKNETNFFA